MRLSRLAKKIAEARQQVVDTAASGEWDQYQANTFSYILRRIDEMAAECESGQLRPRDLRYGELARMAIESDPAALPPKLGGTLIDVEEAYQHA